jgi:hypothetical protein
MKKYQLTIVATILAVITAGALMARITFQKRHFDKTVSEALKTSEGYDQKFIDMVNRLEYELALRASFGYSGRKDPMTGKERQVVRQRHVWKKKKKTEEKPELPAVDSVKLTAIIYDDAKNEYTAIIMVGERSFAIETGDYVVGRRITTINSERVIMNDEEATYFYDITGEKAKVKRGN